MKITKITNKHLNLNLVFNEDMETSDIFRYLSANLSLLNTKGMIATSIYHANSNMYVDYADSDMSLKLTFIQTEVVSTKVKNEERVNIDSDRYKSKEIKKDEE